MANGIVSGQLGLHEVVCIKNAKILALLIILCCFCYHGLLHLKYGYDTCEWLLSDGRFHGNKVWQPFGCMAHVYSKSDSRDCMRYISYWGGYSHIVFIGDSRVRQQYFQFVQFISNENLPEHKAHTDLHYRESKIKIHVSFLWHPMVDESMLEVYKGWIRMKPSLRPNLIITGSATWSIKTSNASKEALNYFRGNMTALVSAIDELGDTTKVLWMLQEPVEEDRLSANRSMITNDQIDDYNRVTYGTLMFSSVHLWSSSRLVAHGNLYEMEDGIHLGKTSLYWDTQILLNMYCNKHLNFIDGSCCKSAERATLMQIMILAVLITSLVIAVSIFLWRIYVVMRLSEHADLVSATAPSDSGVSVANGSSSFLELISCLARLAIIMVYFFVCDRTTFFMKENKYYTTMNFFLPFAYLMILGLFFHENAQVATVLNRDQTDEWKGWMQLVILIYHFTGASKILKIYIHIRILVSAYLFLSGYGHFSYFYNKGDFSVHRFLTVLVRFNLLVVLLCLVMNRPYQFYYFVPMVSFWFVVVYLCMAIWPRVTSSSVESTSMHYLVLLIKSAVFVAGISLLFDARALFDKLFLTWPFRAIFLSDDDSLRSWRFRWQLDRYSMLSGMIFAFITITARKFSAKNESSTRSSLWLWFLGIIALAGLIIYETTIFYCKSKEKCNELHSYITFIPIVAFIYFRNFLSCLRTRYSTFFAWFGKISLELFISQYHILLSADTHGLLVLVPGSPHVNAIVTSFVFVCASHEIHCITDQLLPYLVPSDWRKLTYNIVIGIALGLLLKTADLSRNTFH